MSRGTYLPFSQSRAVCLVFMLIQDALLMPKALIRAKNSQRRADREDDVP